MVPSRVPGDGRRDMKSSYAASLAAKLRNAWTEPAALTPGKVDAVNFSMPDINHTFRRGHRIMVQVQSSWFPLADLNPQTFANTATATRKDFTKATERVYHAPQAPSGITLGVVPQP